METQTPERMLLAFRVSNQITRPMIMVNSPQMTVRYPLSFNHPLVVGKTIPGTESKKVTKTKTALPIAAILSISAVFVIVERLDRPLRGHVFRSSSFATDLTVGVAVLDALVIKAKIMRRPPVTRKRRSVRIYVRRILSFIMASMGIARGGL